MNLKCIYSNNLDETFINEVLELDKIAYPNDVLGTFSSVSSRFNKNRDSYVLAYCDNKLVGYFCFFPITDEIFEKMESSNVLIDDDLTENDIEEYRLDKGNNIFIISLVTQKDNKTDKVIKKVDYTGTWGIYPCYQGRDDDMVHIEDREEFFNLIPDDLVFRCVSMDKDMLTLKYGEKKIRVNPKLYKVVKEPKYKIGDNVEIIEKSLIGQITDIHWHFKDEIPFYFLKIEEKKLKRRYKESELRKVMNLSLDNVHIAKYEIMKKLNIGDYSITIQLEPDYCFNSSDNKHYDDVINLMEEGYYTKTISIKVEKEWDTKEIALIIGWLNTDIDIDKCVLPFGKHLFLRSNNVLCLFDPVTMKIIKKNKLNTTEIFEVYPYHQDFILYGEMDIYRITRDLSVLWNFSARDILVRYAGGEPAFEMKSDRICLYDFKDNYYEIDYDGNLIK